MAVMALISLEKSQLKLAALVVDPSIGGTPGVLFLPEPSYRAYVANVSLGIRNGDLDRWGLGRHP